MPDFSPWLGSDVKVAAVGPAVESAGIAVDLGAATIDAKSGLSVDLDATGYRLLRLAAQIGNGTVGATAAADCNPYAVPYLSPGQLLNCALAAVRSTSALASGIAWVIRDYDVSGWGLVRLALSNNNATLALPGGKLGYFLST